MSVMSGEYDFVVVGAGSAGCIVAARLSESGAHSVALIEAGGEADSFWFKAPLGFGKLYAHKKYNWGYEGEAEPHLGGHRTAQPRGKVLGGTSAINGMVYMRGQREDYDHWLRLGNVGWGYDDVLPFFRKSEDNDRGANEFHGAGGPLTVSSLQRHDLADAFVAAGNQAGHPENGDLNGLRQEGFSYNQVTMRNGERCSTAVAFLAPARSRPNLRVITEAQAERVVFRNGEAVAVEIRRDGRLETVGARREIVLCTGAFDSPKLLQLSGVGPGALLQANGVPIVADLRGVGENLQDHFTVTTVHKCRRPITINDVYNNPIRRYLMGAQYLLFRSGVMAGAASIATGHIRTDPALATPDVGLHLQLWSRSSGVRTKGEFALHPFSGFGLAMSLHHPESRGHVRIRSPDPSTAPELLLNLFGSAGDRRTALGGLRAVRHLMAQPALHAITADEYLPGPACDSDDDWIEFCRQNGRSSHHPTSSCAMGIDECAVVDPRLRVRHVGRLRIADASIMPRIVAGNPNAPTIMIGEKCAAMMLEDARA